MICYKDRTYCPYYLLCKNGHICDRAFTQEVEDAANKWWGGKHAPICLYSSFPDCFVRFFEEDSIATD